MAASHNNFGAESTGVSAASSCGKPNVEGGLKEDADEDSDTLVSGQGDSGYRSYHGNRTEASDTVDAAVEKSDLHSGTILPSQTLRREEEELYKFAANQTSKSNEYIKLEEGVLFSKFIVTSKGKKTEIICPDRSHYRRGERHSSTAEWVTGALLGEGAYGKVYTCEDVATRKQHAVKQTKLREFNHVEADSWLRLGFSRHVCGLNAITLQDGVVWWHMELINPRVSLKQLVEIHQPNPLQWGDAITIATGIFAAIAHIHSCNIKHCDLHPGNVMLCRDLRVKVIDFSLLQPAMTHDDFTLDIQNGLQLFLHMVTAKNFRFAWTEEIVRKHIQDAKVLPLVLKMFQPVTNQTAADIAREFPACNVKGIDEADGINEENAASVDRQTVVMESFARAVSEEDVIAAVHTHICQGDSLEDIFAAFPEGGKIAVTTRKLQPS